LKQTRYGLLIFKKMEVAVRIKSWIVILCQIVGMFFPGDRRTGGK
jgi:hypothetical protein